jgi:DNA polymerase
MQADAGITRFRGTWRDIDAGAGDVDAGAESISALASFHPAYLLRSPDMKRLAWRDLLEFHGRLAQFRP